MHIHKDHTCRHKQHQLDQRVVYHVQEAAAQGDRVFPAKQTGHTHAHQNKADLGDGGAGQCPFQVNGEQGEHRADHHGKNA